MGLPIESWHQKVLQHREHFTVSGFEGLLDHHGVTNSLGERLVRHSVTPEHVRWLMQMVEEGHMPQLMAQEFAVKPAQPAVDEPFAKLLQLILSDPQAFWQEFWSTLLDRQITLPVFPHVGAITREAFLLYRALPIAFPKGFSEDDYPDHWIKPLWGKYLDEGEITKRKITDRWVMIETIDPCDWNDSKGYGAGSDPLIQALDLKSRFRVSFDDFMGVLRKRIAKLWGRKTQQVRLPGLLEWNASAQVLLELNKSHGTTFANWGDTASWEWCADKCGSGLRLLVGRRARGGLADVYGLWSDDRRDLLAFRVLVVL